MNKEPLGHPWERLGGLMVDLVNAWEDLSSAQKAELIHVAPESYFATARVVRCCQVSEEAAS